MGRAENWSYEDHYELRTEHHARLGWHQLVLVPLYGCAKYACDFASKEAIAYWKDVDLYIGGAEHATGHLLYSRFWNKFLKDLGYVKEEEPFKKLINQGMIQGRSNFVYRVVDEEGRGTNTFVSHGLRKEYKTSALHVDVNIVENEMLNIREIQIVQT